MKNGGNINKQSSVLDKYLYNFVKKDIKVPEKKVSEQKLSTRFLSPLLDKSKNVDS